MAARASKVEPNAFHAPIGATTDNICNMVLYCVVHFLSGCNLLCQKVHFVHVDVLVLVLHIKIKVAN